jgi:ABC-type multidrug transport system fused ATPase/permease subunit
MFKFSRIEKFSRKEKFSKKKHFRETNFCDKLLIFAKFSTFAKMKKKLVLSLKFMYVSFLQVFSSIIRQETAFFDKNKTGELINRLSADSQLVSQTVTQQVRVGSTNL